MKRLIFMMLIASTALVVSSCNKDKADKVEAKKAEKVTKTQGAAKYAVNAASSAILWEGYKPTGTHNGSVNIKSGNLDVTDGVISGGNFVIDMNSISTLDLDGEYKTKLDVHLKGTGEDGKDDFFNVEKYPEAKFEITKVTSLKNDTTANFIVYGNLTIRDKTHNIPIKAKVSVSGDDIVVATPKFSIDRTKWGIQYNSKSIFPNLKDHVIDDEMGLKITLMAKKQ